MGTKQLERGSRVLIVDDVMRGGSTAAGMLLVAKEFGAEVCGIGVFLASAEPEIKAVSDYTALFSLKSMGKSIGVFENKLRTKIDSCIDLI